MKQLVLCFFLFNITITYSQVCDSLEAPCLGTFSRNGYYFDLEAVNDIRVTGLNYLVQNAGTRDISLWYRTGTYFGFEGVASNWTLIGTDSNITPANGGSCPLPLNRILQDFNICIPAGQKYGFYLAVSSGTGTVETHNTLPEGTIAVQDVNVKLITGKGQFGIGNFSGTLMGGLTFQGSVRYSCLCGTEVEDLSNEEEIFLYPNPSIDKIYLRGKIDCAANLSIVNAIGKTIVAETIILQENGEVFHRHIVPYFWILFFKTGLWRQDYNKEDDQKIIIEHSYYFIMLPRQFYLKKNGISPAVIFHSTLFFNSAMDADERTIRRNRREYGK